MTLEAVCRHCSCVAANIKRAHLMQVTLSSASITPFLFDTLLVIMPLCILYFHAL